MHKDRPTRYSPLAQWLHWLSALLLVVLFGLGLWMVELGYYHDWYHRAPWLHIGLGLLLTVLTVIRLVWQAVYARPAPRTQGAGLWLARAGQGLMYALLILLPVTGYLITGADGSGVDFFGLVNLPSIGSLPSQQVDQLGQLHLWAAWLLIALALGHTLAALDHHWRRRDDTLRRMLPGGRR